MKIWSVLIVLLPFTTQFVSAAVVLSSDAGTDLEVCSGTEVTFTCTASADTLEWGYSQSPNDGIVGPTTGNVILGPFTLTQVTGSASFTSTATAAITEGVNGSLTCATVVNRTDNDIITIPSIKGPPSFIPTLRVNGSTIEPVGDDQWEFNLEWEVPPEDCDLEYVITVDPPLSPLPSDCTVNCTTQCRTYTIGRDGPYNFIVTAQDCGGTQIGNASEPLQVCFEPANAPDNVCSNLTYQRTGQIFPENLKLIDVTWSPVPGPKDPAPGVSVFITGYQITVTGMTPIDEDKDIICTTDGCSYQVDVSQLDSPEYTVSVAAIVDLLGPGDNTTVGPYSATNDYAPVSLTNCSLIVTCTSDEDNVTVTVDPGPMASQCSPSNPTVIPLERSNDSTLSYNYVAEAYDGCFGTVIQGTILESECEPGGGGGDDDGGDGDGDGDGDGGVSAPAIGGGVVGGVVAAVAVAGIIALLVYLCCPRACCCERKKKARSSGEDEVELKSPTTRDAPEAVAVETGALYQDPGEIKREEFPGTHDEYALPDMKRKTHKPEDHLPTYADPNDIGHVEAPETGELYAEVDKRPSQKRKKKRAPSPPTEEAPTYSEVDMDKKHKGKELNYSELKMPAGGPAPPPQNVEYSTVQS